MMDFPLAMNTDVLLVKTLVDTSTKEYTASLTLHCQIIELIIEWMMKILKCACKV